MKKKRIDVVNKTLLRSIRRFFIYELLKRAGKLGSANLAYEDSAMIMINSSEAQQFGEELINELISSVSQEVSGSKNHKTLLGFALSLINKSWRFPPFIKNLSRPIYLKYKKTIDNYS
jgi:hypothetical protein